MKYIDGFCYLLSTNSGKISHEKHFSLDSSKPIIALANDAIDIVRDYINCDHLSNKWVLDLDSSGNELIYRNKYGIEFVVGFVSDDYIVARIISQKVESAIKPNS